MTYKVLDNGVERDATPDEVLEIDNRAVKAVEDAQKAVEADMAAYLGEVRTLRMELLNAMAGIATSAMIDGDTVIPAAYKQSRQRLLDITQVASVIAATNRKELEAAVEAEYASIVAAAPDTLRTAFREIQP